MHLPCLQLEFGSYGLKMKFKELEACLIIIKFVKVGVSNNRFTLLLKIFKGRFTFNLVLCCGPIALIYFCRTVVWRHRAIWQLASLSINIVIQNQGSFDSKADSFSTEVLLIVKTSLLPIFGKIRSFICKSELILIACFGMTELSRLALWRHFSHVMGIPGKWRTRQNVNKSKSLESPTLTCDPMALKRLVDNFSNKKTDVRYILFLFK